MSFVCFMLGGVVVDCTNCTRESLYKNVQMGGCFGGPSGARDYFRYG